MTQRIWLTENLHLAYGSWEIWIAGVLVAIVVGALIGAIQGGLIAYIGIPSFIVTLGRLVRMARHHIQDPAGPDDRPYGQELRHTRREPFQRQCDQRGRRRDRILADLDCRHIDLRRGFAYALIKRQ